MKHGNIAFFIPHMGCPHRCTFCDQRVISGENKPVSVSEIAATVEREMENAAPEVRANTEIAFFGGSFTAIDRTLMTEYLSAAKKLCDRYSLYGIRLSTRPDAVDDEVLTILKQYGVRDIELGAQSTSDRVLLMNERGHTARDIFEASDRIREYGMGLGLQIMPGLYGDDDESIMHTAEDVIKIKPDTVRIYPTVVVRGTVLHRLYEEKKFTPLTVPKAASLCAEMMMRFEESGINVIKVGLHSSTVLEKDIAAGPYHQSFKEICESKIFYDKIKRMNISGDAEIFVNPKSISKIIGNNKENLKKFQKDGLKIKISTDEALGKYEIKIGRKK